MAEDSSFKKNAVIAVFVSAGISFLFCHIAKDRRQRGIAPISKLKKGQVATIEGILELETKSNQVLDGRVFQRTNIFRLEPFRDQNSITRNFALSKKVKDKLKLSEMSVQGQTEVNTQLVNFCISDYTGKVCFNLDSLRDPETRLLKSRVNVTKNLKSEVKLAGPSFVKAIASEIYKAAVGSSLVYLIENSYLEAGDRVSLTFKVPDKFSEEAFLNKIVVSPDEVGLFSDISEPSIALKALPAIAKLAFVAVVIVFLKDFVRYTHEEKVRQERRVQQDQRRQKDLEARLEKTIREAKRGMPKVDLDGLDNDCGKGAPACIVCVTKEAKVVLGCGHVVACFKCTKQILKQPPTSRLCPTCRATIVFYMAFYQS